MRLRGSPVSDHQDLTESPAEDLRARLRESMYALVERKHAQLGALLDAFDDAIAAGPADAAAWDRVSKLTNDGDVRTVVAYAYCLLREERLR